MPENIVVFCTCGAESEAARVARLLVERRLAACVNIVTPVRSIYRWQGAIEEATEWLLIIKSSRARFAELAEAIRAEHSYELPEVVALPIVEGSAAYLAWLNAETHE